MAEVERSLSVATALVSAGNSELDHKTLISDWTKAAVLSLKNSSSNDKNELQRLNAELKKYLSDVRVLEELNAALLEQVERERQGSQPQLMDKSSLDEKLQLVRVDLEKESLKAVEREIKIDEAQSLAMDVNERTKFLALEADLARKKIYILETQLSEFQAQKETLLRGAAIAADAIQREEERISKGEIDLERLRKALSSARSANKKIEFEIHTYSDEVEFRKEVHKEECDDLRRRPLQGPLSTVDLNNFYKKELINAVSQIRQDFQNLNENQLNDYKKHKEGELAVAVSVAENEKRIAIQAKAKRDSSRDLDGADSLELSASLKVTRTEIEALNNGHISMMNKLASLESKLYELRLKNGTLMDHQQSEIDDLKAQNDEMLNELDYWGRVTRVKLENEIQTYRSILNCQVKLMGDSASEATIALNDIKLNSTRSDPAPLPPSPSKLAKPEEKEAIDTLRQVFNYFDSNKNGTVNSMELDTILQRLNIRLNSEGYNQLCREFDKDSSRTIDFNEFCQIMLPVFTGKFDDSQLLYAFNNFDKNKDGSITVEEMRLILSKIGQHFTEKEIQDMIATVDTNSDGKLSFDEFKRLMKIK